MNLSPDRSQTLSNGVQIPLLGLGTTHFGGYNHDAVVAGLRDFNYRMIDTAKRYGVEELIGQAIVDSKVPREEMFLISKLWSTDFGFNSTIQAYYESCRRLGTDYLDSYLIHFPEVPSWFEGTAKEVKLDTWRALERLYDDEKVRSIGVSNYGIEDLEELLDNCSVAPHIDQVEFHPYQNPKDLRQFCRDSGKITFMGFCPLAKGTILTEAPIKRIAEKRSRTAAQVCIRWSIQQGVPAIPKSTKVERIRANSAVFDFTLSDEDMSVLNELHDDRRLVQLDKAVMQEKFKIPCGYKLHLNGAVVKLPSKKSHERHHSCKEELVESTDLNDLDIIQSTEETSTLKTGMKLGRSHPGRSEQCLSEIY